MRNRFKVIVIVMCVIIVGAFGIIEISNSSMEPYKVVEGLIKDAKLKKKDSGYLVPDESGVISSRYIVESLNWEEFVEFINNDAIESVNINPKYSLTDRLRGLCKKERIIEIYTYDKKGNEIDKISIVLQVVDHEWKVIGKK